LFAQIWRPGFSSYGVDLAFRDLDGERITVSWKRDPHRFRLIHRERNSAAFFPFRWQRSGEIIDMNGRKTTEARRQRPGFVVIGNPEGPLERNPAMRIRMQVREKEVCRFEVRS
jgi:hypothetical protein